MFLDWVTSWTWNWNAYSGKRQLRLQQLSLTLFAVEVYVSCLPVLVSPAIFMTDHTKSLHRGLLLASGHCLHIVLGAVVVLPLCLLSARACGQYCAALCMLPCCCRGSVVAIDSAVPRHEDSMVMGEDEVSNILSAGRLGLFSNEMGPARHHSSERPRHNFRPY